MTWPEIREAARRLADSIRGETSPLRDPAQAGVLIGGALLVVAARLAWIDAELPFRGRFAVDGFEDPADGVMTFIGGLALVVLGWSRGARESRLLSIAAAPLLIAAACLALAIVDFRLAGFRIESFRQRGGDGAIGAGIYGTAVGALIAAAGGALRLRRGWAAMHVRPHLDWRIAAQVLAGVGGAVGGFALGLGLAASAFGSNPGALTFSAMFGGLAGIYLGAWLAGLATGRALPR